MTRHPQKRLTFHEAHELGHWIAGQEFIPGQYDIAVLNYDLDTMPEGMRDRASRMNGSMVGATIIVRREAEHINYNEVYNILLGGSR